MNISQFIAKLVAIDIAVKAAEKSGLKAAGKIIEHEAKAEIGHYQSAVGPLPAWAPLSSATLDGFEHPQAGWIEGKLDQGYGEDPLLREGHLRESISSGLENDHTAVVGSNDENAVWQELGTPDAMYPTPPRSFLERAAIVKGEAAAEQVGARVVWAIRGLAAGDS